MEYFLADSQPPHLFILRKLYRHGSGAITTLAFYYVLDGSVYQAPSLQAALLARMVGAAGGMRAPACRALLCAALRSAAQHLSFPPCTTPAATLHVQPEDGVPGHAARPGAAVAG